MTHPEHAAQAAGLAPAAVRIILNEHMAVAAVLKSLKLMLSVESEPDARFFDVLRAMLFYIDEFPERLHHPKETQLLFPRVAERVPELRPTLARLAQDHTHSEAQVRELQHLLLAWELLGDSRRGPFERRVDAYVQHYLDHMRAEEQHILPAAQRVLSEADWAVINTAFAQHSAPLASTETRDAVYERLYARIVMCAPAPIGVG